MSHISPPTHRAVRLWKRIEQAAGTSRPQPVMRAAIGGSLLKVIAAGRPGGVSPGGPRGAITEFSAAARRRLIDFLAEINQKLAGRLPLFLTLTYPAAWPDDPAEWKRHLDNWLKRLARRHPGASAVWRLEFQVRGAPHFHLLLWGCKWMDRGWLSGSWFQVVGSGDQRHHKAGTRVEFIRSWRGVMWYAAKYVAKKSLAPCPGRVGRFWGVFNRAALPVDIIEVPLTWGQYFRFRRVLVAHARAARRSVGRGYVPRVGGEGRGLKRYIPWPAALRLMRAL